MYFFISSPNVEQAPAARLIEALWSAGHEVDHSPRGPQDPRWAGWYAAGCRQAIERADTFIIVLDRAWDSSTWMGIEAETGLARTGGDPRRFVFWNPLGLRVTAAGAVPYLRSELPTDLAEAVARLTHESSDTRAIREDKRR